MIGYRQPRGEGLSKPSPEPLLHVTASGIREKVVSEDYRSRDGRLAWKVGSCRKVGEARPDIMYRFTAEPRHWLKDVGCCNFKIVRLC